MTREQVRLVWYERDGAIQMAVVWTPGDRNRLNPSRLPATVRVSNLTLPCLSSTAGMDVVYSTPVQVLRNRTATPEVGPVFAVLTGGREGGFVGNRAHFRDLARLARRTRQFLYVLPDDQVGEGDYWTGYVRVRPGEWRPVPCPRPQAVYNRIPLRHLERAESAETARRKLRALGIPLFNPEYFNKAVLYRILASSEMAHYLPETAFELEPTALTKILAEHRAVYLKPAGGSMGHGMMRIDRRPVGYQVQVLKHGQTRVRTAADLVEVWQIIRRERLPGGYVVQAAKSLVTWQGRPCDFRILLQKRGERWQVVGVGVRVAGEGVITTHVPNGGSIVSPEKVLHLHFPDRIGAIDTALKQMARACAGVIDAHYHGQLGEMSMDIGVDEDGRLWFFEANSKPMKFDEPEIWQRGLMGTLAHLTELALAKPVRAGG
jgi:hypothetical protein